MNSTLVYSHIDAASTDGVINIGRHTDCIYFLNRSESTHCTVRLNGQYDIFLHHSHNQADGVYIAVPGDYTTVEVVTAGVTVAIFAVG